MSRPLSSLPPNPPRHLRECKWDATTANRLLLSPGCAPKENLTHIRQFLHSTSPDIFLYKSNDFLPVMDFSLSLTHTQSNLSLPQPSNRFNFLHDFSPTWLIQKWDRGVKIREWNILQFSLNLPFLHNPISLYTIQPESSVNWEYLEN